MSVQPVQHTKPNGPVAAAFIAAGVGCFALGALVVLNTAGVITNATLDFAKNYGIGSGVGPLSGRTPSRWASASISPDERDSTLWCGHR